MHKICVLSQNSWSLKNILIRKCAQPVHKRKLCKTLNQTVGPHLPSFTSFFFLLFSHLENPFSFSVALSNIAP